MGCGGVVQTGTWGHLGSTPALRTMAHIAVPWLWSQVAGLWGPAGWEDITSLDVHAVLSTKELSSLVGDGVCLLGQPVSTASSAALWPPDVAQTEVWRERCFWWERVGSSLGCWGVPAASTEEQRGVGGRGPARYNGLGCNTCLARVCCQCQDFCLHGKPEVPREAAWRASVLVGGPSHSERSCSMCPTQERQESRFLQLRWISRGSGPSAS